MATRTAPLVPLGDESGEGEPPVDAAMQRPWRKGASLSSVGSLVERFLALAGFDRAAWLAIALASGIAAWFALPGPVAWYGWIIVWSIAALTGFALWQNNEDRG